MNPSAKKSKTEQNYRSSYQKTSKKLINKIVVIDTMLKYLIKLTGQRLSAGLKDNQQSSVNIIYSKIAAINRLLISNLIT